MRILITNESRGVHGGIETYLRALSARLVARGHGVAWLFGESAPKGLRVDDQVSGNAWTTTEGLGARSEIEHWQPDVVFANGLHDPAWDAWCARRYPTFYFAHGYFGACISGRKCQGSGPLHVCQRKLGPGCLVQYLPRRCGGRSPVRMIRDYGRERHRQRNLRDFSAVIVASQYMAQEFHTQGVSPDRVRVLPLFPVDIEPDAAPPRQRTHWTNNVLLVSRLTDIKGADLAVECVAVASGVLGRTLRLVVLGEGPLRTRIEAEAGQRGVPLAILGWTNSETRNAALRDADALLVPSVWPEPFGLVGIEAGCVGVPSVAFEVGGTRDWLRSGTSGEAVREHPPGAKSLGEALATVLVSLERHQHLRMGAWSISREYGVDRHVDRLTEIFDEGVRR